MLLNDVAADRAFESLIDACFPYADDKASTEIIRQGWAISLNAACCVLEEICRPPAKAAIKPARLLQLSETWFAAGQHPIQLRLRSCARALIDGQSLPWRDGIELMNDIAQWDGQRAALNLVYFASDRQTPQGEIAVDAADAAVRELWNAKGV